MDEKILEQEIHAKGLNAPRITPSMIEATISREQTFTIGEALRALGREADPSFDLLTISAIKLVNGFTVIGESACASPENFDAEIGAKLARDDAKKKIWPLEGYLLKSKLWQIQQDQNPAPT